jgi:peroxiredoxin
MVVYQEFENINVQVLGISADNPFSQKMFATSMDLQYPLLSDHPDLETIERYGVLKRIGKAKRPIARGAYVLVDKAGIIRGKWIGEPGKVFPNETLLKSAYNIVN